MFSCLRLKYKKKRILLLGQCWPYHFSWHGQFVRYWDDCDCQYNGSKRGRLAKNLLFSKTPGQILLRISHWKSEPLLLFCDRFFFFFNIFIDYFFKEIPERSGRNLIVYAVYLTPRCCYIEIYFYPNIFTTALQAHAVVYSFKGDSICAILPFHTIHVTSTWELADKLPYFTKYTFPIFKLIWILIESLFVFTLPIYFLISRSCKWVFFYIRIQYLGGYTHLCILIFILPFALFKKISLRNLWMWSLTNLSHQIPK